MRAVVTRSEESPNIDAVWEKAAWEGIEPLVIDRHVDSPPEHYPRACAKVAYDDRALYVIFRVQDRYVRAVARQHQDRVCSDTCVEFFFCPGTDVAKGYFNIEMNCGGTMLFHFQKVPRKDAISIDAEDLAAMRVAHSMPSIVEPEVEDPVTWTVEYDVPFSIIEKYGPFAAPARGAVWRANFYKCGDETSHPHWLTWAPVDRPKPDFHVPECFGVLEFG